MSTTVCMPDFSEDPNKGLYVIVCVTFSLFCATLSLFVSLLPLFVLVCLYLCSFFPVCVGLSLFVLVFHCLCLLVTVCAF